MMVNQSNVRDSLRASQTRKYTSQYHRLQDNRFDTNKLAQFSRMYFLAEIKVYFLSLFLILSFSFFIILTNNYIRKFYIMIVRIFNLFICTIKETEFRERSMRTNRFRLVLYSTFNFYLRRYLKGLQVIRFSPSKRKTKMYLGLTRVYPKSVKTIINQFRTHT